MFASSLFLISCVFAPQDNGTAWRSTRVWFQETRTTAHFTEPCSPYIRTCTRWLSRWVTSSKRKAPDGVALRHKLLEKAKTVEQHKGTLLLFWIVHHLLCCLSSFSSVVPPWCWNVMQVLELVPTFSCKQIKRLAPLPPASPWAVMEVRAGFPHLLEPGVEDELIVPEAGDA